MSNIYPYFWFTGGKAEEAAELYTSVFPNSRITNVSRYGDAGPGPAGSAMVVEFTLDGQECMGLNGGSEEAPPSLEFRGGLSLFVNCKTQAELDRIWAALAVGGKEMPCGWVIDRYGFAWNLVPDGMVEYLSGDDAAGAGRAMQAMLGMQKLDLATIRVAYEGAS